MDSAGGVNMEDLREIADVAGAFGSALESVSCADLHPEALALFLASPLTQVGRRLRAEGAGE